MSGNVGRIFNTIYSFPGAPGGCNPQVKLTIDLAGNLYGTTGYNGPGGGGAYGFGLVFGTPTKTAHDNRFGPVDPVFYDLQHGLEIPMTNLVFDASGLYVTQKQVAPMPNSQPWEITPAVQRH